MARAVAAESSEGRAEHSGLAARIAAHDWRALEDTLDARGHARLPGLLAPDECTSLAALYLDDRRFYKVVDMDRHRFGSGEYRYFDRPLPALVQALRTHLYRRLAPIANRWRERLGDEERFPASLSRLEATCREVDQTRPTPLLLRYGAGGFNCLHQDLYGQVAFPIQVAVLLSRPPGEGEAGDFSGGELLLAEQRPRQQARVEAIHLARGEGLVFPTSTRPVEGVRGWVRANMRHGVSRVHSGERTTLGIIFHDR